MRVLKHPHFIVAALILLLNIDRYHVSLYFVVNIRNAVYILVAYV